MDVCRQFTIGVSGEALAPYANPLFSALASLFPVEFRPWTQASCNGFDALIVSGQYPGEIHCAAATRLPVFAAPTPLSTPAATRSTEFQLEQSSSLHACFRGYRFSEQECIPAAPLPASAGDEVLASQDGKPIWLQRHINGAKVTLVTWPLPYFGPGEHIHENFQSSRFLRLLPLLQFLRNLTRQVDWQSPPTPACLLVDDPSLHSLNYGHLDFRRVAAQAREQNFYVSVATVPLDCWGISRQTAELLRENAPRLSVVVQGNDHTSEELAHAASDAENIALLAQALRRVQHLEEQTGIEVCRVMECPHGSLSVTMLEPMAKLSYEAVFASTAHLLRCNRGETFPASLGAERSLLGRRAAAIIPRIRARTGWQAEVRLAAFWRQPIVLAAHHWDFAGQSHLADEFAEIVNSLPDVCWTTPTGVARSCYQYLQVGDILHIRLGSRLVDVSIPDSVQSVMIHRPWLEEAEPEVLAVHSGENELFHAMSSADVIGPIPLRGSTALQVSSSVPNKVDCNSVPSPRHRYWPLVRKLMVEVRDRSRLHVHLRGPGNIEERPQSATAPPQD